MKTRKQESKESLWLGAGLAVGSAWVVDRLGEPPVRWHPVVWYGNLIKYLERWAPRKGPFVQSLYGSCMLVVASGVVLPPVYLLQRGFSQFSKVPMGNLYASLLEGLCLKPFFALRMLVDAGKAVRFPLEQGDLVSARDALRSLVSRDRSRLNEELVAAATVESLAENLSDSIVAPLFFYALFGLPGAALYRLYNTFDSMIGYHGRYEYLGKAAARWDDVLNSVPSRLTALLIILSAPLYGGSRRTAWRIWRRDAGKTESPNAGHPMAAAAGALGVCLEKVDHYALGDRSKAVDTQDIQRAEKMVWLVGGMALVFAAIVRTILGGRHVR